VKKRRDPITNVEQREKLYEGKAKIVYSTGDRSLVVQYFKDDATAFNALKKGTIVGKGVVNNRMSATLFQRLAKAGVPTHYIRTLSDREMLCRRLDIIKIETIVRNVVAGSLAKRTGLEEGTPITQPITSPNNASVSPSRQETTIVNTTPTMIAMMARRCHTRIRGSAERCARLPRLWPIPGRRGWSPGGHRCGSSSLAHPHEAARKREKATRDSRDRIFSPRPDATAIASKPRHRATCRRSAPPPIPFRE